MKRKNYNLMIGGAITLFFLAVALIGQFWTPYGTTTMDSMAVNLAPCAKHTPDQNRADCHKKGAAASRHHTAQNIAPEVIRSQRVCCTRRQIDCHGVHRWSYLSILRLI